MFTILILVLILMLVGSLPTWPHSRSWGYYPSGGMGLIVLVLTCAMHCAQFDVTTGQALSGPVPPYLGKEPVPPRTAAFLHNVGVLMQGVRTETIRTYPVQVLGDWVWIDLQQGL